MKKLPIFALLLFILIGCKDEDSPVAPDTPEVHYLPVSMQGSVSLDFMDLGYDIDTAITDTNEIIGLTRDSLFLYTHDNEGSYRDGSSRANPVWSTLPVNADLIAPYLEPQGYSVKSFEQTGSETAISVSGTTLQLVSRNVFSLEVHELPVAIPVNVDLITIAEEYNGVFLPENWPDLLMTAVNVD